METCYKVFRAEILKRIQFRENRFGFEPEFTAKVSKAQLRIYEVPISYSGRDYSEGKRSAGKMGLRHLPDYKIWLFRLNGHGFARVFTDLFP